MKKIQNKAVFLLFVYFGIFVSLSSSWAVAALHIPSIVSKGITLMVYLPLILAIGYKVCTDALKIKQAASKVSNWIYYAFALYYVALCIFRLANRMEVKENLYYAIIFFGAVAIYMLLRDKKISVPKQELEKSILWIAAFFILYRLVYVLFGAKIFLKSPININLTTGIVAFLLPFVGNVLTNPEVDKKKVWLPWMVLCAGLAVIATSGSRALFALTGANIAVMLAVTFVRRKGLLRLVTAIAVGCTIVVTLLVANVGQVRYSVYRQTGIDFGAIRSSFETRPTQAPTEAPADVPTQPTQAMTQAPTQEPTDMPIQAPTEAPTQASTEAPTEMPAQPTQPPAAPTQAPTEYPTMTPTGVSAEQDKVAAQEQIAASNWMRKRLTQRGIVEIKENILFGTGDVLYDYYLGEETVVQSSHNFVIEGLVCFGLVGMAMIAALFVALLFETKLFTKMALRRWNDTVVLALAIVFYFAFGFVQPTVFDVFFCPLILLLMLHFRNTVEG